MSDLTFSLFAPPLLVAYGMLMTLLAEILAPRHGHERLRDLPPVLALLACGFALASVALRWASIGGEGFAGTIVGDRFALFGQGVLLVAAMLTVLSAWRYLRTVGEEQGEFYALLLASTFGGMLMVGAADLIMVFLGLEILSIAAYVLAGFLRRRTSSGESAIKYFFLGAFSTAFLLYGVALLFGAAGSTHLTTIGARAGAGGSLIFAGMALLLVGFGFKIAAFPFQVWTPDVYQGAPAPVTGFMAAAVKTASFLTLLRVLWFAFGPLAQHWVFVLYYVAIATMVFGNFAALVQGRVKRILAYSSIAHAGYILVGLCAVLRQPEAGVAAVMFYLAAYTLMTVGAFAVVAHLSRAATDADRLEDYRGLAKRHPWLAAAMAIYLVSMAGLPPLVGFVGKFLLFAAAVKAGLVQLAVIGVLTSAVSVYYYLRIVYVMYMTAPEADEFVAEPAGRDVPGRVALALTALAVVVLGILPHAVMAWAGAGAAMLLGK